MTSDFRLRSHLWQRFIIYFVVLTCRTGTGRTGLNKIPEGNNLNSKLLKRNLKGSDNSHRFTKLYKCDFSSRMERNGRLWVSTRNSI